MVFKTLLGAVSACVITLGFSSISEAAFIGRLETAPGSGIYQAYYDDQLDITWTANANINGFANWDNQTAWAAGLDIDGITGWRLPTIGPNCDFAGITQEACKVGEYGHLFHYGAGTTLGNGITFSSPGPFSNVTSDFYWSSSEDVLLTRAFRFSFVTGLPTSTGKIVSALAWAVHDGDVSAVPVPAAVWLFGSGLIGLIGVAKRKKS